MTLAQVQGRRKHLVGFRGETPAPARRPCPMRLSRIPRIRETAHAAARKPPPSPSLTHKSAYLSANRYLFIRIYTHIHPIFWQRTNASIVDYRWIKSPQKRKSSGFGAKINPQPNLSPACAFVDNLFSPFLHNTLIPKTLRILAKKYASYAPRGGRNPAAAGRIYRGMRFSPQGCG